MDAARKPDNGPGNPTPAAVTDMVRYDPLQNITYGRDGSPVPLLDDRLRTHAFPGHNQNR